MFLRCNFLLLLAYTCSFFGVSPCILLDCIVFPKGHFGTSRIKLLTVAVRTQKAVASPPEQSASQVHVATRFTRAAVCTRKVWKKYLIVSGDSLLPDTCQFIGSF